MDGPVGPSRIPQDDVTVGVRSRCLMPVDIGASGSAALDLHLRLTLLTPLLSRPYTQQGTASVSWAPACGWQVWDFLASVTVGANSCHKSLMSICVYRCLLLLVFLWRTLTDRSNFNIQSLKE